MIFFQFLFLILITTSIILTIGSILSYLQAKWKYQSEENIDKYS